MVTKEFYNELEEYINSLKDKKDDVKILNFVIEKLDSIPMEVQKFIAEKTGLMEISIENTINFYPKFRNKVAGKKVKEVAICVGMTCGSWGKGYYDELAKILEIDEKGISKDGKIQLTTKRCFGRCAKGPNMSIDGTIYSMVTMDEIKRRLNLK
ncbi:NAD(P)H-dependent oxidoreductase subunit E [uncultured Fusobacterium sp.]|jgi:NADH:ubiquinone oxidoreductase subunit E|uniref:NADH-quinone oxidoreductase subunit NuoE family protein n=1 Tax=uncultured Fusobacterium sp. TaxID=159267 RepID=UPI0025D9BD69|nr:NAD(P)H-dependent oxidoreductase subunit E [uncultured Fusobacterium sp.]MCF2638896.1 NAD(P)H-dependent oxidoreductase subunit E [Fusobacterium varium]